EPLEEFGVGIRVAIRGKAHHLVLVKSLVAQQLDDLRIEFAERLVDAVLAEFGDLFAFADQHHSRTVIAFAVEHEDQCAVKARRTERAPRMREMMLAETDFISDVDAEFPL